MTPKRKRKATRWSAWRSPATPARPPGLDSLHGDAAVRARGLPADVSVEQPPEALAPDDVDDPEFVAAMQEREAGRLAGYVDALCLGCGCVLYVPEAQRCGDVLCPECQRVGEALARAEDAGGPGRGEPPCRVGAGYSDALGQYSDGDLIDAVASVSEHVDDDDWVGVDATNPERSDEAHPTIPSFLLKTAEHKHAFLAAATAEVLRRVRRGAARGRARRLIHPAADA